MLKCYLLDHIDNSAETREHRIVWQHMTSSHSTQLNNTKKMATAMSAAFWFATMWAGPQLYRVICLLLLYP